MTITHRTTTSKNVGSPAIVGSFVAIGRRGGGEDPWLCVSGFRRICLYRRIDFPLLPRIVNSGYYLAEPSTVTLHARAR
jgi:hypothetical protein